MSGKPGSFESFRAQSTSRSLRRAKDGRPAPAGAELLRLLESAERKDLLDRQLRREMEEFFEDSARVAAQALRKLTDAERKRIERKVLGELREFIEDARRRAADLATRLKEHEDRRRGNGGETSGRGRGSEPRTARSGNAEASPPDRSKPGRAG
ncbi:MAG TPA: hypothetical protein VFI25_13045 [Planctomycetota bacterium]|jgi:predicted house-cleaning noncanonical NTP pyrophosphatase (MazG superfamily)|nr:hypothetical protein [Planctomycetota bacterium]